MTPLNKLGEISKCHDIYLIMLKYCEIKYKIKTEKPY